MTFGLVMILLVLLIGLGVTEPDPRFDEENIWQ
jgi:hypothetical protein